LVPGIEGAGIIDAVGEGATRWRAGQRVVYYVPDRLGAYAEAQVVPADRAVQLPDALSFQQAVSVFDHGLTAHYLTSSTFPIQPGHRVLVQAAAGGVGSLIVQMAKRFGATVYGTVSSVEKADAIRQLGADAAILYRETDVGKAIHRLTDGEGVHVVYDSTGKDTIQTSVECLARRGMLVLYGQSSGPVSSIDPAQLADHGSLFFTRPHLLDHITPWTELKRRSDDIFDWLLKDEITVTIGGVFDFESVAAAHRRLEDRTVWGKLILAP
jgi:NADPH2:quinone reductase